MSKEYKPNSYSDIVLHTFKQNKAALLGAYVVGLLLFIALIAPAIASEKPFLFIQNGNYSSPWLSDFFHTKYFENRLFNLLLVGTIIVFSTRAKSFKYISAVYILVLALGFCVSDKIDATNYLKITNETDATGYFPPIAISPFANDLSRNNPAPPSNAHYLGTDSTGRDLASRLIHGSRVSMSVGFVATGIAVFIGIIIGSIAGYFRGITDDIICRAIEVMMCFPTFFLILTIITFLPRSIFNVMIVIGLTGWTGIARLIRGEFLKYREQEFVLAARALGASDLRIIFRHILPNALSPVLVSITFGIAGAILTESGLSFLGLGVAPPTASWGESLSGSRDYIRQGVWWLTFFPGAIIFISILSYNLVGEGLRDAMDPRHVARRD